MFGVDPNSTNQDESVISDFPVTIASADVVVYSSSEQSSTDSDNAPVGYDSNTSYETFIDVIPVERRANIRGPIMYPMSSTPTPEYVQDQDSQFSYIPVNSSLFSNKLMQREKPISFNAYITSLRSFLMDGPQASTQDTQSIVDTVPGVLAQTPYEKTQLQNILQNGDEALQNCAQLVNNMIKTTTDNGKSSQQVNNGSQTLKKKSNASTADENDITVSPGLVLLSLRMMQTLDPLDIQLATSFMLQGTQATPTSPLQSNTKQKAGTPQQVLASKKLSSPDTSPNPSAYNFHRKETGSPNSPHIVPKRNLLAKQRVQTFVDKTMNEQMRNADNINIQSFVCANTSSNNNNNNNSINSTSSGSQNFHNFNTSLNNANLARMKKTNPSLHAGEISGNNKYARSDKFYVMNSTSSADMTSPLPETVLSRRKSFHSSTRPVSPVYDNGTTSNNNNSMKSTRTKVAPASHMSRPPSRSSGSPVDGVQRPLTKGSIHARKTQNIKGNNNLLPISPTYTSRSVQPLQTSSPGTPRIAGNPSSRSKTSTTKKNSSNSDNPNNTNNTTNNGTNNHSTATLMSTSIPNKKIKKQSVKNTLSIDGIEHFEEDNHSHSEDDIDYDNDDDDNDDDGNEDQIMNNTKSNNRHVMQRKKKPAHLHIPAEQSTSRPKTSPQVSPGKGHYYNAYNPSNHGQNHVKRTPRNKLSSLTDDADIHTTELDENIDTLLDLGDTQGVYWLKANGPTSIKSVMVSVLQGMKMLNDEDGDLRIIVDETRREDAEDNYSLKPTTVRHREKKKVVENPQANNISKKMKNTISMLQQTREKRQNDQVPVSQVLQETLQKVPETESKDKLLENQKSIMQRAMKKSSDNKNHTRNANNIDRIGTSSQSKQSSNSSKASTSSRKKDVSREELDEKRRVLEEKAHESSQKIEKEESKQFIVDTCIDQVNKRKLSWDMSNTSHALSKTEKLAFGFPLQNIDSSTASIRKDDAMSLSEVIQNHKNRAEMNSLSNSDSTTSNNMQNNMSNSNSIPSHHSNTKELEGSLHNPSSHLLGLPTMISENSSQRSSLNLLQLNNNHSSFVFAPMNDLATHEDRLCATFLNWTSELSKYMPVDSVRTMEPPEPNQSTLKVQPEQEATQMLREGIPSAFGISPRNNLNNSSKNVHNASNNKYSIPGDTEKKALATHGKQVDQLFKESKVRPGFEQNSLPEEQRYLLENMNNNNIHENRNIPMQLSQSTRDVLDFSPDAMFKRGEEMSKSNTRILDLENLPLNLPHMEYMNKESNNNSTNNSKNDCDNTNEEEGEIPHYLQHKSIAWSRENLTSKPEQVLPVDPITRVHPKKSSKKKKYVYVEATPLQTFDHVKNKLVLAKEPISEKYYQRARRQYKHIQRNISFVERKLGTWPIQMPLDTKLHKLHVTIQPQEPMKKERYQDIEKVYSYNEQKDTILLSESTLLNETEAALERKLAREQQIQQAYQLYEDNAVVSSMEDRAPLLYIDGVGSHKKVQSRRSHPSENNTFSLPQPQSTSFSVPVVPKPASHSVNLLYSDVYPSNKQHIELTSTQDIEQSVFQSVQTLLPHLSEAEKQYCVLRAKIAICEHLLSSQKPILEGLLTPVMLEHVQTGFANGNIYPLPQEEVESIIKSQKPIYIDKALCIDTVKNSPQTPIKRQNTNKTAYHIARMHKEKRLQQVLDSNSNTLMIEGTANVTHMYTQHSMSTIPLYNSPTQPDSNTPSLEHTNTYSGTQHTNVLGASFVKSLVYQYPEKPLPLQLPPLIVPYESVKSQHLRTKAMKPVSN